MAPSRASFGRNPRDSISLQGSEQSQSRSQLPIDEEDGFYQPLPRQPWWSQLLENLGFETSRQRQQHSQGTNASRYNGGGKSEYYSGSPRSSQSSIAWTNVKQACLLLPLLILMLFGLLHFMQVMIGRASLLWDIDDNNFLPNWGRPGDAGDGVAHYPTDATRGVQPVPVHSHNDYWRRIPLFEALNYGCMGVEADVWLFGDDLYVGHNTASLTKNRTLRSLYIDPLLTLLEKMNPHNEFGNTTRHGVWDTDYEQTLVLLIDIKTDGALTLPMVEKQLQPLREQGYLTYFDGEKTVQGAITVVGTGKMPFDLLVANTTYRDIFYDAPLAKLWEDPKTYLDPETAESNEDAEKQAEGEAEHESAESESLDKRGQGDSGTSADITGSAFTSENSYYASIDFRKAVGTTWRGHLTPRQIHIIRGQIRGARKQGLKARYWNTPMWPINLRNHVWSILVREGAGMLNADDLRAAATQDWTKWQHEWW